MLPATLRQCRVGATDQPAGALHGALPALVGPAHLDCGAMLSDIGKAPSPNSELAGMIVRSLQMAPIA